MSTLVAESPVAERRTPVPSVAPPSRESQASSPAERLALRAQLAQLLNGAGLAKLDILLFIAIYAFVILLVIAMCLSQRIGHAQAWEWGRPLMNLPLAWAGLGLLIVATIAAGTTLPLARRSRRGLLSVALGVATLGCLGFVATLVIDLDAMWRYGIRPGDQFRPNDRYVARHFGVKLPKKPSQEAWAFAAPAAEPITRTVNAANGRKLFLGTCMSCHGARGEGLPGQGKSLIANEFVGQLDEAGLLNFLKVGRQPWDRLNTTKVQMPARGGNPMLSDDDLRDIVAYVRTLQSPAPATAVASDPGTSASAPAVSAVPPPIVDDLDPALLLPRWVVTTPPAGPAGLSPEYVAEASRPRWKAPRDAVAFVNGYFTTAEFGGLHAGAMAIVLAVLFVQALRGRIGVDRRAPLALGLAGCFGLTLFWLVVFPFLFVL